MKHWPSVLFPTPSSWKLSQMGTVGSVGTGISAVREASSPSWDGGQSCWGVETDGISQCSHRSSSLPPPSQTRLPRFQAWEPRTSPGIGLESLWGAWLLRSACTLKCFYLPCRRMLCEMGFIVISFQKDGFPPPILFHIS